MAKNRRGGYVCGGWEGGEVNGNCTKHNTSSSFCEFEGLGNIYRVS